jgi:hypothetical protein
VQGEVVGLGAKLAVGADEGHVWVQQDVQRGHVTETLRLLETVLRGMKAVEVRLGGHTAEGYADGAHRWFRPGYAIHDALVIGLRAKVRGQGTPSRCVGFLSLWTRAARL